MTHVLITDSGEAIPGVFDSDSEADAARREYQDTFGIAGRVYRMPKNHPAYARNRRGCRP